MKKIALLLISVDVLLFFPISALAADLQTESQTNPTNVTDLTPEFTAIFNDPDSNDYALYFRLQTTATSSDWTNLIWDSAKTALASSTPQGTRSEEISYSGASLASQATYYWRIKFWDNQGDEGAWSVSTSTFIMGRALQNISYIYDKVGNITQIEDTSDLNGAKTTEYQYDDLHRLTRASSTNAVYGGDYLETYSYNAIGNITNKSDQGNYGYEGNTGTRYENPHAATSIGEASYAYDNNGNLTSDGVWTHSWDYDNRLIQSTNGTTTIGYTYDHNGNRLTYSDGTATTTYFNKYYSVSTTGTTTKNIFLGDQLIATVEGNGIATSTYYIHTDHLTDSNVITDADGQVEQLIDYYPFGDMRINEKAGAFDEKRKFTGHEYDAETGLNYMVARYQNPAIGRFISQDPWDGDLTNPQSLNKYSYVLNNPLKFIDPFGLRATTEHETKSAMQMLSLWSSAVDKSGIKSNEAETFRNAYNFYTSTIRNLPEGGDPKSFTIMNDAVFKWYDNQKGNTNWSKDSEIKSDYYKKSDSGDYKCNFFVGKTLNDSFGITPKHAWWSKNPPLARDWVNNKVDGFSSVDSPNYGDVISFDLEGSTDHAGFYFGNGLYISVTDRGRNGNIEEGVLINPIPYYYKINYNRLDN